MKRLIYCSVRVNNVNFIKVSVVKVLHSSGPKAAELNFSSDLDQRHELFKRPFLFCSECAVGGWDYKPTKNKAKQSPLTGRSAVLNF